MGYVVACMSIRLQTSKTRCLTQPAMRAKEPTIGPHCHSATITAARGWEAHFFPLIIGLFFPLYQQCFWRIWSLSLNLLNGSKHFFFERPKCREPRWFVSFWDWSVDGTVGSCYESAASTAKEEEGKNIHLKLINFGSEEKILSSKLKCHLPNIIL